MTMRIAIFLLVLCAARVVAAGPPGTLTVLAAPDGELQAMRIDAIRAEAAVRGLHVEVLASPGSDALAAALVQRNDVAAVLWCEGSMLWVRTPDGRVAHAPLVGDELSPRVVAAIASSLIDDVLGIAAGGVRVDVDVHIGEPVAPGVPVVVGAPVTMAPGSAAPGAAVTGIELPASERPWYLDIGGLAAPGDIYEAHLGLGRYVSDAARGALVAHAVKVPGGAVAAASLELSKTWGQRVRAEAGGRAIGSVTFHDDVDFDSGECMQTWSKQGAFGVGGYFGVGVRAAWGTVYARAGVDFVGSTLDPVTPTPSGALGVELPL